MSRKNESIRASSIVWIFVAIVVPALFVIGRLTINTNGAHPVVVSTVSVAHQPLQLGRPRRGRRDPDREAYFGETHQHTSWSFDAYIFGNHLTGPADAYKYWKGETIKHPLGYDIKIDTPLDWAGVTDHSEYAGVVRLSNDPYFAAQQDADCAEIDRPSTVGRKESTSGSASAWLKASRSRARKTGSRGHGLEG